MRLNSYNPQNRYQRRNSERRIAFISVVIMICVAFGTGLYLGKQNAGQQEKAYKKQLDESLLEREVLQNTMTELRAETQTALTRYEQLQETYNEILPEGPLRELTAMLKQQLDEGKSPERLGFLIRSARPPRGCTEPETKRFVVSTPSYDGSDSQISVANGALVIKGAGQSAMSTEGKAEAWYDPAKSIKIDFIANGETVASKDSAMPIRHSIIVDDREYRITIAEGARSFAKVTFDSCDYP